MKLKLFFTIWITFLVSVIVSTFIYTELVKRERIRALDSQIESLSGLLANSDLIGENISDLKEADEIIRNIVGGYRLGLVIVLRDRKGKIIYRNQNAARLNLDPSMDFAWSFIEVGEHLIRMYRRGEEGKKPIFHVGLSVDKSVLSPIYTGPTAWNFGALLLLGSALLAFWLTNRLLKPLRRLAVHLNELAKNFDASQPLENRLPRSLLSKATGILGRFDELSALIQSLRDFLKHLRSAFRLNLAHSAQLAHEIKTPLTIVRNSLQVARDRTADPELTKAIEEIDHLASFVDRYLEWGESVNRPLGETQLHALNVDRLIPELLERMKAITQGRVRAEIKSSLTLFANRADFEHLLINLIQNAIKYSPESKAVIVRLEERRLSVVDEGPGIPSHVINRLGEPYNLGGNTKRGMGLGLSLVHLISKKYHWDLKVESSSSGSMISVEFPEDDDLPLSGLA